MSLLEEFVIALRISPKTATPLQLKKFFPVIIGMVIYMPTESWEKVDKWGR